MAKGNISPRFFKMASNSAKRAKPVPTQVLAGAAYFGIGKPAEISILFYCKGDENTESTGLRIKLELEDAKDLYASLGERIKWLQAKVDAGITVQRITVERP